MELSVRREHALFTPTFHATVVSLAPMVVHESFDVQGHQAPAAAAEAAMVRLRSLGYRLTGPVQEHTTGGYDAYATAHLVRDEQEAATVQLAADLVADARAIVRALPLMGTREGAEQIARLVADLTAGALAIKARAAVPTAPIDAEVTR